MDIASQKSVRKVRRITKGDKPNQNPLVLDDENDLKELTGDLKTHLEDRVVVDNLDGDSSKSVSLEFPIPNEKVPRTTVKATRSEMLAMEETMNSEKLRSLRSVDGVPYVGLVKETRAIVIANERADMDGLDLFLYKLKRRTRFCYDNFFTIVSIFEGSIRSVEGRFGSGVGAYFRVFRMLIVLNMVFCMVYLAILIPALVTEKGFDARSYSSFPPLLNFSSGVLVPSNLVYALLYFLFLSFSVITMIIRLRDEFLRDSDYSKNEIYSFSQIAFTYWDFGIKGKETVENQHFAIANAFKEVITVQEVRAKKELLKNKAFFARRLSAALICAGIFAISGFLIQSSINGENTSSFLGQSIQKNERTAILLGCLNLFLPPIFELACKMMTFADPQVEQALAVFLSFFAKMGGLVSVCFLLPFVPGNMCKSMTDNYMLDNTLDSFENVDYATGIPPVFTNQDCWEKTLGSTLQTLLFIDIGITILSTWFVAVFKKFVLRKYMFEMKRNTLELAYRQSVIWIGVSLEPSILYIGVLGYLVVFWMKMFVVKQLASPPRRIYSAHKQIMQFILSLLGAFVVVLVTFIVGFVLAPPGHCGPSFSLTTEQALFCEQIILTPTSIAEFNSKYNSTLYHRAFTDVLQLPRRTIDPSGLFCTQSDCSTRSISQSYFNRVRDEEALSKIATIFFDVVRKTNAGQSELLASHFKSEDVGTFDTLVDFFFNPVVLFAVLVFELVYVVYLKALAIKRNNRVTRLELDVDEERQDKRLLRRQLRQLQK